MSFKIRQGRSTFEIKRNEGPYRVRVGKLDPMANASAIWSRTAQGDANLSITVAAKYVALTAPLTASRTWTLPAASDYPVGQPLRLHDAVGGIAGGYTLTIQRAGADTIDSATSLVLSEPYDFTELISDGVSNWEVREAALKKHVSGVKYARVLQCSSVLQVYRTDISRPSTPRTLTIGSVAGAVITVASNAHYLYYSGMAGISFARIWNTSKVPAQSAWVMATNDTTTLTVTNAADIATWVNGETIRAGDPNPTGANILGMVALDISQLLTTNFGAPFRQKGLFLTGYCSSAGGGASSLDWSMDGSSGSAVAGVNATDAGARQFGSGVVFCAVQSPISNSNLVYFRETLISPGTGMSIAYARVQAVLI